MERIAQFMSVAEERQLCVDVGSVGVHSRKNYGGYTTLKFLEKDHINVL